MNIAVISKGENLYSTKSILNAGLAKNHVMEVINPDYCTLAIVNKKPVLYYYDEVVDDLDAVIPRIGSSNTFFGASLVRHLTCMGVFSVASAEGILQSRNKWTTFQVLSQFGVALPKTILGNNYDSELLLKLVGGAPLIIKVLQGTHGEGVILAESNQAAISTIETLKASGIRFLVQEYIAESNGCDIRVIIVNSKIIAAMKRKSKPGEFRSNLHRGGSAQTISLTQEEKNMALTASNILGLPVCGVDILQSKRGPLLLEINSTPGLEGIEKTTNIDVASPIISFIESSIKPKK